MPPLISALMLTTKRRWFFHALAIESWLHQRERQPGDELVIVSEDALGELRANSTYGAMIRFVTVPPELKLAEKRNLGVHSCSNPWILMWDDDDWHGLDRLKATRAAASLERSRKHFELDLVNEPPQIVGQREMVFHELVGEERSFLWWYPDKAMDSDPYVAGGTLAFAKSLWEKRKFVEQVTPGDEGWWTVERLRDNRVPYQLVPQTINTTYIAMIHGKNNMSRAPRVSDDGTGRVLSDSNMRMLIVPANRETLMMGMPTEVLARYHAAAWAESGEQE